MIKRGLLFLPGLLLWGAPSGASPAQGAEATSASEPAAMLVRARGLDCRLDLDRGIVGCQIPDRDKEIVYYAVRMPRQYYSDLNKKLDDSRWMNFLISETML